MKKYLLFLFSVCCFSPLIGQVRSPSSPGLSVGDKVPGITISNFINYSSSSAKLSDFGNKLVILDFWATWCSNCIQAFPHNDSLQKAFESKIIFIGVAYEPDVKIKSFYMLHPKAKQPEFYFPTITGDTLLSKLFPHLSLPHYVWIGSGGKILAITGAEQITATNISVALKQSSFTIDQKFDIDPERPLFINENIDARNISHFSVLYKGKYSGLVVTKRVRYHDGIVNRVAVTNQPLLNIYEVAAEQLFKNNNDAYYPNRLILEKDHFGNTAYPNFKIDIFCYDFITPVENSERFYASMLDDLNKCTGYDGRIEMRKMPCLILKWDGDVAKLRSTSSKHINGLYHHLPAILQSSSLSVLTIWLNTLDVLNKPIFNETGYTNLADLSISDTSSFKELNKSLQTYGLKLTEEERTIEMFVISNR